MRKRYPSVCAAEGDELLPRGGAVDLRAHAWSSCAIVELHRLADLLERLPSGAATSGRKGTGLLCRQSLLSEA